LVWGVMENVFEYFRGALLTHKLNYESIYE
jgi:hypothetical protein